jgi:hypothetical protein
VCVADVLQTADLDCCCVGHVGNGDVVATGRGALAWVHRLNTPTETSHHVRQSPESELRLLKYAERYGFAVYDRRRHGVDKLDADLVAAWVRGDLTIEKPQGITWMVLVDAGALEVHQRADLLRVTEDRSLDDLVQEIRTRSTVVHDGYSASALVVVDEALHALDDSDTMVTFEHTTLTNVLATRHSPSFIPVRVERGRLELVVRDIVRDFDAWRAVSKDECCW